MGYYTNDEILGYKFRNGKTLCSECAGNQGPEHEDEIITEATLEDGYCFCDDCHEKI